MKTPNTITIQIDPFMLIEIIKQLEEYRTVIDLSAMAAKDNGQLVQQYDLEAKSRLNLSMSKSLATGLKFSEELIKEAGL